MKWVILVGIIVFLITVGLSIFCALYIVKKNNKAIMERQPEVIKVPRKNLSFDECNHIIDDVIMDVYTNKYLVYYRLKDMTLIPDMDDEIKTITTEICGCFSDSLLDEIMEFYTRDYFIKKITRTVQKLLIDYVNTYKPNTR